MYKVQLIALATLLIGLAPAGLRNIRAQESTGAASASQPPSKRYRIELLHVDPQSRDITARNEANDEVLKFALLPFARMFHHATLGDATDYRVGERLLFTVVQPDTGPGRVSAISDELMELMNHKEYYFVDEIDRPNRVLIGKRGKGDKSLIRDGVVRIETRPDTNYWKEKQQVDFEAIQIGDKLIAKTHGTGKGTVRVAWDILLDDETAIAWQTKQEEQYSRMARTIGYPGRIEEIAPERLHATLVLSPDCLKDFKSGAKVVMSSAGPDLELTTGALSGTLQSAKFAYQQGSPAIVADISYSDDLPASFMTAGNVRIRLNAEGRN